MYKLLIDWLMLVWILLVHSLMVPLGHTCFSHSFGALPMSNIRLKESYVIEEQYRYK